MGEGTLKTEPRKLVWVPRPLFFSFSPIMFIAASLAAASPAWAQTAPGAEDVATKLLIGIAGVALGAILTFAVQILNELRTVAKYRKHLAISLRNYHWHAQVTAAELPYCNSDNDIMKIARLRWAKFTDSGLLSFKLEDFQRLGSKLKHDFLEFLVFIRNNDLLIDEVIEALKRDKNAEIGPSISSIVERLNVATEKAEAHLSTLRSQGS